ncbi:hypothetical protein FB45DRAFT_873700 [Roridomyces roridus]|uniref:Uncharacterized protein n=1 Tax=Roridomyces roridus TaxID=1738132 RepID=A0AAD7B9M0_9AGAR|nr:hypothetical protein FB45DRAFT_873700 [Roridomyces roridus]
MRHINLRETAHSDNEPSFNQMRLIELASIIGRITVSHAAVSTICAPPDTPSPTALARPHRRALAQRPSRIAPHFTRLDRDSRPTHAQCAQALNGTGTRTERRETGPEDDDDAGEAGTNGRWKLRILSCGCGALIACLGTFLLISICEDEVVEGAVSVGASKQGVSFISSSFRFIWAWWIYRRISAAREETIKVNRISQSSEDRPDALVGSSLKSAGPGDLRDFCIVSSYRRERESARAEQRTKNSTGGRLIHSENSRILHCNREARTMNDSTMARGILGPGKALRHPEYRRVPPSTATAAAARTDTYNPRAVWPVRNLARTASRIDSEATSRILLKHGSFL